MKKVGLSLLSAVVFVTACSKEEDKKDSAPKVASQIENENQKMASSKFIKGTDFCKKFESITSKENGFAVQVPVDYKDASKGTTRIWAFFTSGAYNPNKPTMIFFDGGSGGNTHQSPQALRNFNELHYDQRGIGCSHPETLELYRNPDFYSNENNARDADEIRKALKIKKVSVYGASYGTVVATIYASIFKDNTTAAVLDGTVFSYEDDFHLIGFYLRKMYKELPEGTKQGMKKFVNKEDQLINLWSLARVLMYNNKPFDNLAEYLQMAFKSENEINTDIANRLFNPNLFQDTFFGDDIGAVEEFNNQMLNCKNSPREVKMQLSLFGPADGAYHELTKYDYVRDMGPDCADIGVKESERPYTADQYPIEVPVTYFQGSQDGATFASETVAHYKKVATGKKQLVIAVKGGHCPGYQELGAKNEIALQMIEAALRGEKITKTQIDMMNAKQKDLKWVYTDKNSK